MEWYEKFERLRKMLGDETVILAVQNYFSSDDLDDLCNQMISDYDLDEEFKTE